MLGKHYFFDEIFITNDLTLLLIYLMQ